MDIEIVPTLDGSNTLFVKELNEHYHSVNGAVNESLHVFIQAGLASCTPNPIRIFEVGFGTGLNAIMTYRYALAHGLTVEYHAIEKYPLNELVIQQLGYANVLNHEEQRIFEAMHCAAWGELCNLNENFCLKKIEADLIGFRSQELYDLIYMDAFAPSKQAEMWQVSIFELLGQMLPTDGVLVTYSSKGDVKRALRQVGFKVKRLVGPPGKHDMVRAVKL